MTKMVMKRWTGNDGLVSNNLTSVNQTANGFLWITSFNGLHRLDGNGFKLFDKESSAFLKTNSFQSVASDGQGVIAATEGSGVVRYQDGQLTSVSEFEISSAYKLLVDSKGRIWCGTNLEGLHVMENGEARKIDFELFDNVLILDIHEDNEGRIWVATEGNGLFVLESGTFSSYKPSALADEKTFTSIIQCVSGEMVFGTVNGLYIADTQSNTVKSIEGLNGAYVNDVVEDKNEMLWVATEKGLYRTNHKTEYFEVFNELNGLPAKQVSSVAIDHEESIWLSTKKAGLIRLNLGSVVMIGERDGLTSQRINITKENGGKLYIGCDDGSIFVQDGSSMRSINLSTKENQVGVRDFMFENGTMWVASYQGLHSFSRGREELLTTTDGLSSNLIRRILKSKDGFTWLASRTGGVMKMSGDQVIKIYNKDNGLNSDFVLAIEEDHNGNIIVGTHSGGISIINDEETKSYVPETKGLVNFNIHIDEKNRYWISTSNGVLLFENENFRKLKIDASFKTEAIFDFVDDGDGNVWLTSTAGIIKVSNSQLSDFANGNIDAVKGRIFDNNDGMSIKECTGATRSTLLSSGKLCFPTLNGVATIRPSTVRSNRQVPQIAITSFSVDDRMRMRTENEVDPGKLRYQFEFITTSYLAANRVRFKYQLSDVDENWITTASNKIEYTNLAPGTYTFSVLGSNGYGVWNEVGDRLTFTVEPFYYQTFGFKVLIALLFAVVFYFIFIWRVRRVQAVNDQLSKVNAELDRFVYSASHDIRAPLTSILGATKIAIEQSSPDEKNMYLGMIRESAKKLDGFIRDIIDYSRNQRLEVMPEKILLKEEIESIVESLKYLDENEQVSCTVQAPDADFVTDVRRLRVILKNIIANALFYFDPNKKEPFVVIKCEVSVSNLVFTISDNGKGMKEDVLKNIFTMFYRGNTDSKGSGLGLYIVKENIEKLGGNIEVKSAFKKGTTFIITIPQLED